MLDKSQFRALEGDPFLQHVGLQRVGHNLASEHEHAVSTWEFMGEILKMRISSSRRQICSLLLLASLANLLEEFETNLVNSESRLALGN